MTPTPPQPDRLAALRSWSGKQLARTRHAGGWVATRAKTAPWPKIGVWAGGAFGVLVLTLVLFLTFADWNALRGPIAGLVSASTGRPIQIAGNLSVYPWSWTPRLHAQGLRIGNQQRFQNRGLFADVADADVTVQLLPLLWGQFEIVQLDLAGADVRLYRTADGDANWASAPGIARAGKPMQMPAMRRFVIQNGHLLFRDDKRNLTLDAAFTTEETNASTAPGQFALDGAGQINDRPFSLKLSGEPLIHVRHDRPYPFTADLRAGATHIEATGSIARPFDFGVWQANVRGTGADLAQLYPITGLTLPNTPAYALSGKLDRAGQLYRMTDIAGRVGSSDLHGAFTATHHDDGRIFLDGDFRTASLDFDDLLTVLGSPPSRTSATSAHHGDGAAQVTTVATATRLMPDARLDIHRVRNMDARVSYRATHVRSDRFPLRGFSMDIGLDHGLLRLDPLTLELSQGRVGGAVSINARESVPMVNADVRLSNARLESIIALRGDPPITGTLLGRARLSGRGASVREAAAHANGDITLVTPHGEVREAFAELTGINVTKGLGLLLTHNEDKIGIRCGVASFHVNDGIAHANNFVFDTETMLIHGQGSISLRDETLDLRIHGEPKQTRLVRIAAPITIEGPWRAPQLGVEAGRAARQTGIAAVLASLVAPIAAVLPFVDAGLAHDADCGELLANRASGSHDG